jgi:hypothetical protein
MNSEQFDAQNTKEYEVITDAQTLKDIQTQLETAAKQDAEKSRQLAAQATNDEPDLLIETMNTSDVNPDEKKRTYEAAFDDEEEKSASASADLANRKKIRPSESIEGLAAANNESERNGGADADESDSINDASDALSDEETTAAATEEVDMYTNNYTTNSKASNAIQTTPSRIPSRASASSKFNNKRTNDVIEEEDEILEEEEEDDCIIEENSNDMRNEAMSNQAYAGGETTTASIFGSVTVDEVSLQNGFVSNSNFQDAQNENQDDDDDDDDVIECSSGDDEHDENTNGVQVNGESRGSEVIEINGEEGQSTNNNFESSDTNSDSNGLGGGEATSEENSHSNYNNGSDEMAACQKHQFAGHETAAELSGNGKLASEESEDGVTVIE